MLVRITRVLTTALLAGALLAACSSKKGQLIERTIPAPSLGENVFQEPTEQPAVVYLPPSYASTDKRYPVIYLLPGFKTDVKAFVDGTYQGYSLQASMDSLINKRAVAEMIVVVANGRSFLGGSFYVNSPITGNWEDFIVQDVVRYVDENYKTIARADARGITGHSMGGTGALNIAMRHPDVFCAVYAMSPGLFDRTGMGAQGMFAPSGMVNPTVDKIKTLAAMSREQAHQDFVEFIRGLYASGSIQAEEWAFAFAYGAAFSPDRRSNAPYLLYPYATGAGGGISVNMTAFSNYDAGYGSSEIKIKEYRDNLLKLDAIAIDVGLADHFRWIPDGCRYFKKGLDEAGVTNELITFRGGHSDRLRERIEKHMLPFFSKVLSTE
jgi:S-formylglutathione hydrolase